MKIKTITYQRLKNLGNYESARFEATAELDDDEAEYIAAEQLKLFVHDTLDIERNKSIDSNDIKIPF